MRPGFILTVSAHKFNGCLCEYCINFEEKVQVLRREAKANGLVDLENIDKYDVINMTLCEPLDGYHQAKCVGRQCESCGPQLLGQKLKEFDQSKEVVWKEWKSEKFVSKQSENKRKELEKKEMKKQQKKDPVEKDASSKTISKKVLRNMEGDLASVIELLTTEAQLFSAHLFNAKWQRDQLKLLRENLPSLWLLCIEDFAENFRTQFQDEIQSAHYQYEQATVFCIQCYYHCPSCSEEVEESVVCISDDLTHDGHAVNAFHKELASHINSHRLKIEHKVSFSDGCSSQFKSKVPFYYLLNSKNNLGHTTERAYFGTRHGKSVCDSLGGLVKKGASTYVASRQGKL